MATITQRLRAFLSSPQGQRIVSQGRRQLAKPTTQQKLRQLAGRFTRRR
jgi:hypothetical protein